MAALPVVSLIVTSGLLLEGDYKTIQKRKKIRLPAFQQTGSLRWMLRF
jgi:hypothetical protein